MMKLFSKKKRSSSSPSGKGKVDVLEDRKPSLTSSPGGSSEGSSSVNNIHSNSNSNKFGGLSMPGVRKSRTSTAMNDRTWNPFADDDETLIMTPSLNYNQRSTVPAKDPDDFASISDLSSYLEECSNYTSFAPSRVKLYCRKIVELMGEDEENRSLQCNGARALFLLSLQDTSIKEGSASATRSGVKAVVAAMESFPDDAELQSHACVTLERLLAWEANQKAILKNRGQVDVLLSAMEGYVDDTELIIAALGSLYHLSCNPDAVVDEEIAKDLSYAIPPILELLRDNRDRVDYYERGLSTLAKLTEDNVASQYLFCHDGYLGIRVAVDALHNRSFSNDPTIQLAAVLILQHVASHPSVECKGKIVAFGGLDRILNLIQRQGVILGSWNSTSSTNLSKRTMASALQTLANLSSSTIKDQNNTSHKMATAVPVIVDVLHEFSKVTEIQTTGFAALRNLAEVHASIVTQNNGIGIIVKSMTEQLNNPAVQKLACRTLVQLFKKYERDVNSTNNIVGATGVADLVRDIAKEDGIEILFRTVRTHQPRRPVQEPAIEAMYYLSCSRDLSTEQKQVLCMEENVVVLLQSIKHFLESETICERGTGVVLNMSFFAPLRQNSMATVGGIQIVLSVMRRHGLNAKVQEHCAGILSGLCLDGTTHEEFIQEEGISTVLSAMMVHPYQPGVQAFGCDVLASIASSKGSYRDLIVDGNGKQIAKDALSRHKKHRGVQNRGTALLKSLA